MASSNDTTTVRSVRWNSRISEARERAAARAGFAGSLDLDVEVRPGVALEHRSSRRDGEVVRCVAGWRSPMTGADAAIEVVAVRAVLARHLSRHELVRVVERVELRVGEGIDAPMTVGRRVDRVAVHHDQRAVGGQLHIEFEHRGAFAQGLGERERCLARVFVLASRMGDADDPAVEPRVGLSRRGLLVGAAGPRRRWSEGNEQCPGQTDRDETDHPLHPLTAHVSGDRRAQGLRSRR